MKPARGLGWRTRGIHDHHVVVSLATAFHAGAADNVLDQVIASGGAFDTHKPFSVTLDDELPETR